MCITVKQEKSRESNVVLKDTKKRVPIYAYSWITVIND